MRGELRYGQSNLLSDGIGDKAIYTKRGLVFSVFRSGERWLVGLSAGHVVPLGHAVAWDLGSFRGFAILKV